MVDAKRSLFQPFDESKNEKTSDLRDTLLEGSCVLTMCENITVFEDMEVDSYEEEIPQRRSHIFQDMLSIAKECENGKELLKKLVVLSPNEICQIEFATQGQSTNELWSKMRVGRITASSFYKVHTKVRTITSEASKRSKDAKSLVSAIIGETHLNQNVPALK